MRRHLKRLVRDHRDVLLEVRRLLGAYPQQVLALFQQADTMNEGDMDVMVEILEALKAKKAA